MASRITFIIGNGLDLTLGLKTRYSDFHKFTSSLPARKQNKIYREIQQSPENWADFEQALGHYTSFLDDLSDDERKKESAQIHTDLDELIIDLSSYLKKEEQKAANLELSLNRKDFFDELVPGQKVSIESFVAEAIVNFDFVTLNYTRSLEMTLPSKESQQLGTGIRIGSISHLHGTVSQDLTLGVSEDSQLSKALEAIDRDGLIKPRVIQSTNDGRLQNFKNLLASTSILVFFGTSIGVTDKYIWKIVVDWLRQNPNHYIIIHNHNHAFTEELNLLTWRRQQYINAVQDKLLTHSGLFEEQNNILRNRIYVIHNTRKLFVQDTD